MELGLNRPRRNRTAHYVLSPLGSMQRLAVLVLWPGLHLIRFGVRIASLREVGGLPLCELGLKAPNVKLRVRVVQQGPVQRMAARHRPPLLLDRQQL